MSSGAHEGLMCPLEKGVRGIEINKASSDAGPKLAGRAAIAAMESP